MNKTFDPTKPVQTRDGCKARIVDTHYLGAGVVNRPILAIITKVLGSTPYESAITFYLNGQVCELASPNDLVNVPVEHTQVFWVNCYPDGCPCPHNTESEARAGASSKCLATVKVTLNFKEGDGL